MHFVLIKTLKAKSFSISYAKPSYFHILSIWNWRLFKNQIEVPSKFQLTFYLTINPISGLIGQIYWLIMDLFTKTVDLTMILLEKIGVVNIHILSRPHVLVEVLVHFRAMRPGEITHMPLLGSMTSLLMHTVAHSTSPSFRSKYNNQSIKNFLSRVKIINNWTSF